MRRCDNLRANALLALDGSPGHITEVLSGDYYQPLSTSSPHQIWSAAMVISPVLRGMFGLQYDAATKALTFAPHVPADWDKFAIQHIVAGSDSVNLAYSRAVDSITLTAERDGSADVKMIFRPAVSVRAEVLGVTLNGRRIAFRLEPHEGDQHVVVDASLASGTNMLKIVLRNDFAISYAANLPGLGGESAGLRIVAADWNASHDTLALQTAGVPGHAYLLAVWGKEQISSIDGAKLTPNGSIEEMLGPANDPQNPQHQIVTIHFINGTRPKQSASHN